MDIYKQKHNLHDFKLRWEVDKHDQLVKWYLPQLCKDIKIIGPLNMVGGSINPFISSTNQIEGLLIKGSYSDGSLILKFDKFEYEFQDSTFRSTVKKMTTTGGTDLTVFVNIFNEDMLEKLGQENIGIRDYYLLSSERLILLLNMVPTPMLREWLFQDDPSILLPR